VSEAFISCVMLVQLTGVIVPHFWLTRRLLARHEVFGVLVRDQRSQSPKRRSAR
jgi:hypothetical protein